jgi:TIR domain-containing protein
MIESGQYVERPQVFISWSGEASKRIATALVAFLKRVIQTAEPVFSARSIRAGRRWAVDLPQQLQSCDLGIICLTKDNLEAHWLLFEAGALGKSLEMARVIPYLVDVSVRELPEPLRQFQAKRATQQDTLDLVESVNAAVAEKCGQSWRQEDYILQDTVAGHWSDFESKVDKARERIVPVVQLKEIPGVTERTRQLIQDLKKFKKTHDRDDPEKPPLRYSGFLSPFAIHPDMVDSSYDSGEKAAGYELAKEREATIALAKNEHPIRCMICPPCLLDDAPFLDLTSAPRALLRLKNLKVFLASEEYKEIEHFVKWIVSPLTLNNMYILGDDVCYEGLRKQRHSGYDLTLRYSDPGAVKTRTTSYDALWEHLAPQSGGGNLAGLKDTQSLMGVLDLCIARVKKAIKKKAGAGKEKREGKGKVKKGNAKVTRK